MVRVDVQFLKNPDKLIQQLLQEKANAMLGNVLFWVRNTIMPALVDGGHGIEGIIQTDFYQWITSEEGLSELGITASEPPKLLDAYRKSFDVSASKGVISFSFGDHTTLKLQTPHPFTGIGHLQVRSWMEWVLDDVVEPAGFVSRARIELLGDERAKGRLRNAIRLNSPLGGLMLKTGQLGSTGVWGFPLHLQLFEQDWLTRNVPVLNELIAKRFRDEIFNKV